MTVPVCRQRSTHRCFPRNGLPVRQARNSKFVVRGATVGGLQAEAVFKFGPLGNLFVITVYLV